MLCYVMLSYVKLCNNKTSLTQVLIFAVIVDYRKPEVF